MRHTMRHLHQLCAILMLLVAACGGPEPGGNAARDLPPPAPQFAQLKIFYPLEGALFPRDIVAPRVRWEDPAADACAWRIEVRFPGREQFIEDTVDAPEWLPSTEQWETIKQHSLEAPAELTVRGIRRQETDTPLSEGCVTFATSADAVEAPIFYREVNLPFLEAVKDPSRIRWRFGSVSSPERPPILLTNLPVCGNCHSFSADGATLGMDVDYANDKGSYAIVTVSQDVVFADESVITWSDFDRDSGEMTFGLLSQVSPCGRYVISTVKDRSVFVPRPDLYFSQLFFPLKGVLAIYDRETKTYTALPGADDPQYVQSNPAWSPNGQEIVFARSTAYPLRRLRDTQRVLLTADECKEFLEEGKKFKFDLYRVPFNGGKGGEPVPIEGASDNGMSNFFPKYSPDGKWIVFCRADSFMLLQPDSELYIIPAEGGEARRLRCNTDRMNSWHSWSPNGKWLAFTSKTNGPYTQLFLTHVDENGETTPPVLLEHFSDPDRAVNIPEFVNASPDAIRTMREKFIDDVSFERAGTEFRKAKDYVGAERQYRRALELNPNNASAHLNLGFVLDATGRPEEALASYTEALRLDPSMPEAHFNYAGTMLAMGRLDEAIREYRETIRLDPHFANAYANLGAALEKKGETDEALALCEEAVRVDPDSSELRSNLGLMLARMGRIEDALAHLSAAVSNEPENVPAHMNLGLLLAQQGIFVEAAEHYAAALALEPANAGAHGHMGNLLLAQGKREEACVHLLEALRLGLDNVELRRNLGLVMAQQGKIDDAVMHLQKAVELEPDHVPSRVNLGAMLLSQGHAEEAETHLSEALRLDPDNLNAAVNLAEAHARAGRFDTAVPLLETALNTARSGDNAAVAQEITRRLEAYKQGKPGQLVPGR